MLPLSVLVAVALKAYLREEAAYQLFPVLLPVAFLLQFWLRRTRFCQAETLRHFCRAVSRRQG